MCCRCEDWVGASPLARGGGSEHKTRRVNLMEEGAYEHAPAGNGRRIRKPLDNDFLYYAQAGNAGTVMSTTALLQMSHTKCAAVYTCDFQCLAEACRLCEGSTKSAECAFA